MSNLSSAIFRFLIVSLLLSTSVFRRFSLSSACFFSVSDNSLLFAMILLLLLQFFMPFNLNPGMVNWPLRLCMMFSLSLSAFLRLSSSLAASSLGIERIEEPRLTPLRLPFFFLLGVLERETSMLAI